MKSLAKLSTTLVVLFAVIILVDLLALVSDAALLIFLSRLQAGYGGTVETEEMLFSVAGRIGSLQVVVHLLIVVFFLRWFHRAYKNLHVAGLRGLKHGAGWAFSGFLIPLMNLVRPLTIMREIWTGSTYLQAENRDYDWTIDDPSPLLNAWWGFFLVTNMVSNFAGRQLVGAEEIGQVITAEWLMLTADVTNIVAAAITIVVVRAVTRLQEGARPLPSELPLADMGGDG